jgi:DNA-binding NtrC family response regulator
MEASPLVIPLGNFLIALCPRYSGLSPSSSRATPSAPTRYPPLVSASLAPIEANVVTGDSLRDNLHRVEAWIIRRTLEEHGGRRTSTARHLGITREGLYK